MNQYRRTSTAPVLPIAPSPIAVAGQKRTLSSAIPRQESAPATATLAASIDHLEVTPKPADYWKALLQEWDVPILDTVGIEQDNDDSPDKDVVFLETTSDRVEAYQSIELLTAVRRRDLVTLKRIASEKQSCGSTMNACNRFGESILHLACRKGSLDVVQLLVGATCGCSLLVRDDYGRTVLHDACWTVSPPWELIKLILKKTPVLWRVSDVRGHLALQYVPKSAWPQWHAFLSKNKELLKRIMIHSYHQIDIAAQQQPPAPSQVPHHSSQIKQEDSSTNDASGVPSQTLPQHQQATATTSTTATPLKNEHHLPMPLPTPASLPVSAHSSEEKLASPAPMETEPPQAPAQVAAAAPPTGSTPPVPISAAQATQAAVSNRSVVAQTLATSALSLGTGGGAAGTSALQAQSVLAKALAQANPAMVKAISRGQLESGPLLKQGLTSFSPKGHAQASHPPATTQLPAPTRNPLAIAPAPGPATAALNEALRAQSATRSKSRSSNQLLTEQHPHKEPQKQQEDESTTRDDGSKAPLPYAPSISMIAARLKGYQKSTNVVVKREPEGGPAHQEAPQEPVNPLPAVPNPLLALQGDPDTPPRKQPDPPQQPPTQEQGVPSSITTTTNKNPHKTAPPPDPMATAAAAAAEAAPSQDSKDEDVPSDGSSNNISSVTMSASPSLNEENGSDTTENNGATDTDSDRAVTSSSSNPDPDSSAAAVAAPSETPMDTSEGDQGDEDGDNKSQLKGTKKRVVG